MSNGKTQIRNVQCHLVIPVPWTFSTVMLITNMGWDLQLANRDSDLFQLLSGEIQENVATILQSGPGLAVRVVQFSRQEAGVAARLVIRQEEEEETSHHWTGEMIRERLVGSIKENNGRLLSQFRVLRSSVAVRPLVKNCRSEGCRAADCEFSLSRLRFFCLCSAWTENKELASSQLNFTFHSHFTKGLPRVFGYFSTLLHNVAILFANLSCDLRS